MSLRRPSWWFEADGVMRAARAFIRLRGLLATSAVIQLLFNAFWPTPRGEVNWGNLVVAIDVSVIFIAPLLLRPRWMVLARREHERKITGVRPRFGTLLRADGQEIPLVFYPSDENPDVYMGYHAGDESPVMPLPGDSVRVDAHLPGQSIILGIPK